MSDSNLSNPLTAFFHDEFPEQYQEPPGLQENMKPVPDCGEKATKDRVNSPAEKRLSPAAIPVSAAPPRLLTPGKAPM